MCIFASQTVCDIHKKAHFLFIPLRELGHFTNEYWNKMEECSSWFVFVPIHEIHPSGVSLPYPCSRESKPYVEDEVR